MATGKRYVISADVLSQEVDGEMVLMDLNGEIYYGLNEVGARIWQLLKARHEVPGLLDQLESEFEVSRDCLEADVEELLQKLSEAGLIRPA